MTVNHFTIVIKHMWKKDWHQYRHGRTLIQDHAAYMLFIYLSARVGEYFESNMRKGSGRGLLYEVRPDKNELKTCTHSLSRPSTLSSSKMKMEKRRLVCESRGMPRDFQRRRTKGCFTV